MTTAQDQQSRYEFEREFSIDFDIERSTIRQGQYSNPATQAAWAGWQAARALPAGTTPVAEIEWRPVLRHEEDYEVSNKGDLRNKKTGLIQAKNLMGAGYVKADLHRGGTRTQTSVHRLVAQAFLREPRHAEQVNHINGVKTDNRVENLEWVSKSENETHSRYHLGNLCKPIIGHCLATGEEIEFASISIAADHVGVYRSAVGKCANGTLKTAKGWTFKFKESAAQVQAMLAKEQASRRQAQKQLEDSKAELAKLEAYRFAMNRGNLLPPGWQAVPVEPTPAMQQAALRHVIRQHQTRDVYRAMCAAAPRPPAAQEEK